MVSAAVRRFVTVCAVIRLVGPLAAQGVQAPPLTVHSIWGSRDFAGKRLVPVSARPGYQQFAKFSPDGRMVGFVRDHNIYVTDLATGTETALTTDGGENVINGTSDWVYEEELDLRDAFRWSPDG